RRGARRSTAWPGSVSSATSLGLGIGLGVGPGSGAPAGGAQLALGVLTAVDDAMERAQQRDLHPAGGGEAPAPADGGIALGELVPAREPPHHRTRGQPRAAQLAADAGAPGHRGGVEIARAPPPLYPLP